MFRIKTLAAAVLVAVAPAIAMAGSAWSPLIGPEKAEALMDEGEAVFLDIRSVKDYAGGHLELAVNVPYHAWRGPEENPGAMIDAEKVTALLQEAGITSETPVVVTNQGADMLDFGSMARVYWTIKSAGVENVAILNGGLEAWKRSGRALATAEWSNFPTEESFEFSDRWMIDRDGVEAVVEGEAEAILVDARPSEFFTGKAKHEMAEWAGTLASAFNISHEAFFEAPGVLSADVEAIRAAAREAGWTPDGPEIVSFCNTGHWAATNWFALSELAGIEGVKLYPESMVGWTQSQRLARN